jgi:mono/diheme cytochrome c family protein
MMKITASVSALATAFMLSAARAQEGSAEEGHQIAQRFCARCHAIEMKGDSPHPDAPPFRHIAANTSITTLRGVLGEGMSVGHPAMPQWRFGADDVAFLIAYLKSLGGRG